MDNGSRSSSGRIESLVVVTTHKVLYALQTASEKEIRFHTCSHCARLLIHVVIRGGWFEISSLVAQHAAQSEWWVWSPCTSVLALHIVMMMSYLLHGTHCVTCLLHVDCNKYIAWGTNEFLMCFHCTCPPPQIYLVHSFPWHITYTIPTGIIFGSPTQHWFIIMLAPTLNRHAIRAD